MKISMQMRIEKAQVELTPLDVERAIVAYVRDSHPTWDVVSGTLEFTDDEGAVMGLERKPEAE